MLVSHETIQNDNVVSPQAKPLITPNIQINVNNCNRPNAITVQKRIFTTTKGTNNETPRNIGAGPTSQKVDERKSPIKTQNEPMVAMASTPVSKLKPVATSIPEQELTFNSDHDNQPESEYFVNEIEEDCFFSNVDDEGT